MRYSSAEVFRDPAHRSLSLDRVADAANRRNTCSDEESLAIRRSHSVDNLRTTRKSISDSFQRSSDVQCFTTIQTENEASEDGRQHPKPHPPADNAYSKAQDFLGRFFVPNKLSRPSLFSRPRSPSAGSPSPEKGTVPRKHSSSRRSRRVSGEEISNEHLLQESPFYDGPWMIGGESDPANRYDYTTRSASPPPTVRYKRREQSPRGRSGSPEPRRRAGARFSDVLELFRTNTLKAIKQKQSKKFKEKFGSFRFSDEQWMAAFDLYRGIYFKVADESIKAVDPEDINDLLKETEFRGTPSDVLINTASKLMEIIKYRDPWRNQCQYVQLEVWLIGIIWRTFRDEYVRSGVGSMKDFTQKWESLSEKYPDLENDLGSALDAIEGLPRKWIDPNTNAKKARTVMENLFEDQIELKGRVLLASGVDPQDFFIAMSAAFPDVGAILERIHTLDKKIDRVLYGMPVGKKSQAFLASQELDVMEYFNCDEINLSWRSIFAAVDFSLSDRSTGVQSSKSAVKAKLYYDLILEASCMNEQSWLHEHLSRCSISQDIVDVRLVGRKWKTLRDFFKSAQPKAQRITDLRQVPRSKNTEGSSLRRRHVRRSSRSGSFQERAVPEDSSSNTPIIIPNPEWLSSNARREKKFIEHLLSFIRHIRQKPSRKVALAFMVDRKTVLVLLPCFIALSAVFTGVSLIANASDPNTSNFYEQLSTLSQMLFSLYCLMVPLIRASNPIAWSFWLCFAVAMSAIAGISSVVLFYINGQASISFSFVSGTAQIVATMLLIEGVDEVVRRPRMEFNMSPKDAASLGSEDETNRVSHRTRDEEAFDFALPVVGREPILQDVFYRER